MPNRSRVSLTAQILELCLSPVRKTAIMYGAALSYAQLQMYLKRLQELELIVEVNNEGTNYWIITPKGREFLKAYQTIKKIIT